MKILIFNSNEKSRLVVGQLMKELSFSVSLAEDKVKMMQELKSETIDIVLLDVKSFKNTFFFFFEYLLKPLRKTLTESFGER